jgi:hypothetical protein
MPLGMQREALQKMVATLGTAVASLNLEVSEFIGDFIVKQTSTHNFF